MIRSIKDFDAIWQYESAATQKLMNQLTDQSLALKVSPGYRTLGQISWHVVLSIPEMLARTGLILDGNFSSNTPLTDSASRIRNAYSVVSQSLLDKVKSKWTDETLETTDDMYGQVWTKGMTLFVLLKHEIHHRGQITVLMRQAGLPVSGVYGPSKEEWTLMGMSPPTI